MVSLIDVNDNPVTPPAINRESSATSTTSCATTSLITPSTPVNNAAISTVTATVATENSAPPTKRLSYEDRAKEFAKRRRMNDDCKIEDYEDTSWVPGTSNQCERLFSKSRLILTDYRASMKPETFEMILMLKQNVNLWSIKTFMEVYTKADNAHPNVHQVDQPDDDGPPIDNNNYI